METGEQSFLEVVVSQESGGVQGPPVQQSPFPAWQDEKIQSREGKPAVDARYEAACNRLANKAVQRGSADNVTVMVVRIGH